MAYNASEEKQKEICQVPKNDRGEYFRVARVVPQGGRMESVDVRLMYTNDAGDIRPTKKGVRIHTEALPGVVAGIVEALSAEEREALFGELESRGIEY